MNNQSPLIPQGSLVEQKNKGRARFKIAVFFVLAVHGIGLLALLMQGCRREPTQSAEQTSNAAPPSVESAAAVDTNLTAPQPAVAPVAPTVPDNTAAAAPAGGTEYTIAKGDTYSTIASHFHVSVKAIAEANPGVDEKKLQIGKKLHIPAPTAPAVAASPGPGTTETGNGEQPPYKVKSGDTLTKIALEHHTTAKAIRAANDLKTDNIKVGQKLKIPAKATTTTTATSVIPVVVSSSGPAAPAAAAPR